MITRIARFASLFLTQDKTDHMLVFLYPSNSLASQENRLSGFKQGSRGLKPSLEPLFFACTFLVAFEKLLYRVCRIRSSRIGKGIKTLLDERLKIE